MVVVVEGAYKVEELQIQLELEGVVGVRSIFKVGREILVAL